MSSDDTPKGYMKNARGDLIPLKRVKEVDIKRTELVNTLVHEALELQKQLADFKLSAMSRVQEFIDYSGEQYGARPGGKKGNVTLATFDGSMKVVRSIQEHLVFDERLQVAKQLIDKCIHKWSKGTRSEIRVLVNDAFQVDKEGKVSTSRILGLKRFDIKDHDWQEAMKAINDSMSVAGTKAYIRFQQRVGEGDEYRSISLDIAAL